MSMAFIFGAFGQTDRDTYRVLANRTFLTFILSQGITNRSRWVHVLSFQVELTLEEVAHLSRLHDCVCTFSALKTARRTAF